MKDLVIGTDRRTLLSTVSSHEATGTTTAVPAGLRHAIPRGSRLALCGDAPAVVWEHEAWPGRAHQGDVCPVCRAIQQSLSRRSPHRPGT